MKTEKLWIRKEYECVHFKELFENGANLWGTCPFDDSDEVLENGLSSLVGDDCCSYVAEDVRTAGVDGIQVAGGRGDEGKWKMSREKGQQRYNTSEHGQYFQVTECNPVPRQ